MALDPSSAVGAKVVDGHHEGALRREVCVCNFLRETRLDACCTVPCRAVKKPCRATPTMCTLFSDPQNRAVRENVKIVRNLFICRCYLPSPSHPSSVLLVRCHKSYIINAPRAFTALWRIISPMLDPRREVTLYCTGIASFFFHGF